MAVDEAAVLKNGDHSLAIASSAVCALPPVDARLAEFARFGNENGLVPNELKLAAIRIAGVRPYRPRPATILL